MEQLANNKELVVSLMTLENDSILDKIGEFKDKASSGFSDNFMNGLTLEEFRTEIRKRIETIR